MSFVLVPCHNQKLWQLCLMAATLAWLASQQLRASNGTGSLHIASDANGIVPCSSRLSQGNSKSNRRFLRNYERHRRTPSVRRMVLKQCNELLYWYAGELWSRTFTVSNGYPVKHVEQN